MPRHPRRCGPPLRRRGPQATLRHALRGPRPPGAAHRPHAPGSRRGAASLPAAPQLRLRLLSFVSTLLKRIAYSDARSHPMQLASSPHQLSRSTLRGLALHLRPAERSCSSASLHSTALTRTSVLSLTRSSPPITCPRSHVRCHSACRPLCSPQRRRPRRRCRRAQPTAFSAHVPPPPASSGSSS